MPAGSIAKVAGISEQITIRVVTIAGKSAVTGLGGAATNVGVVELTDPGADLGDAAVQGFIGGAAFGGLVEGAKLAGAAVGARDAEKLAASQRSVEEPLKDLSVLSARDWVRQFAIAPPRDQAVFWSGRVDDASVMAQGAAYAARHDGVTLEQVLDERGLTAKMPQFDPESPKSVEAWEEVSRSLVEGASGNVRAPTGQLRKRSIWENVEMPMLTQNPNVESITIIDAATGSTSVIRARGASHVAP